MVYFCNLKGLNKCCNIGSKTLNHGAYEAIPCAPQIRVFEMVGAHEVFSCAFKVFEIRDFGLFPRKMPLVSDF